MAKKVRLAIFSPFESHTETFIKAHKRLPFKISYYYNGLVPTQLENFGTLTPKTLFQKLWRRIFNGGFTPAEKNLLCSLKKQKVKCVLAEYGPTAVECLNVIKHLEIPLIVHFHGYDASKKKTLQKYKDGYTELFQYANAVIAVSGEMKIALVSMGCPVNKIILNPYGPDESFFKIQPKKFATNFISVGRFVDKKAPYYLVVAFKKVTDQFPNTRMIMVGDGPLLNSCRNLALFYKLEKRIDFKGSRQPETVKNLLMNSLAFVQHSIVAEDGDSEGAPVAILEAQAAGLPVISTYHAGIPDIVIHGKTGYLCEEHDIEGMAANMIKMLRDQETTFRMGIAAKERTAKLFTLKQHLLLLEKTVIESINQ